MNDIPSMPARFDPNGGLVEFGDDSRLYVEFSIRPVLDQVKSTAEQRPVFVQQEYVKIQQPGERDFIQRPSTEFDRRRFARHYELFRQAQGGDANMEGTPLSILFPANPEIAENLKFYKLFTVEQLAACNDSQIQNIGMGGRDFVNRAQTYLKQAEKGKGVAELTKRLDRLEMQLQAREEKIAALEAEIARRDALQQQQAAA